MKKLHHPLFSFTLPEGFVEKLSNEISLTAENGQKPFTIRPDFVKVTINEIEDVDNDNAIGDTLKDKFEHQYLSSAVQAEKISMDEVDFKGLTAYALHAKIDTVFREKPCKLRYVQVFILVDGAYYLTLSMQHEVETEFELHAWVTDVLDTLQVHGDLDARKQAVDSYDSRIEKMLMGLDAPKKKPEKKAFVEMDIPEDGVSLFKVNGTHLVIDIQKNEFDIGTLSREFHMKIVASASDAQGLQKKVILSEYNDEAVVSLQFSASGIHRQGIPEGRFVFEKGKTLPPLHQYLRLDGFDGALDFFGTLILKEGWVLVLGELRHAWKKKNPIQISIAERFDTSTLDWRQYRFKSMAETLGTAPENVRFLSLSNPDFKILPATLFSFTALEELYIFQHSEYGQEEKLPLSEIASEIGTLTRLRKLHINGAAIEKLPESIAELRNLEQLSINNTNLKTVPAAVWRIPKLNYLTLATNQLTEIPEHIDLPRLRTLSLEKNKLKTLPEKLALQPKLNRLDLEDNPLETLPDAFNMVKDIKLSIEDKIRLLDFSYSGADGTGIISWDDMAYYAASDPELTAEMNTVIARMKHQEYAPALRSLFKKAIGFTHSGEEDYAQVGNHRFGGMPDLPLNVAYPKFKSSSDAQGERELAFEFIGQINCATLVESQGFLPRKGMLFFFLQSLHMVYDNDHQAAKIIYIENVDDLSSGKRFEFTETDYFEMFDSCYQGFNVSAEKMISAPSFYASFVNKYVFQGEAAVVQNKEEVLDDWGEYLNENVNFEGPSTYSINEYAFTQHESPELQASLALKGSPEDWVTLLNVSSAGDMQWGDAGDLFFVIHKSDLAKRDFSNVFVSIESS